MTAENRPFFNDLTIQKLFGFEDAESEPIDRLKEYYFKTNIYSRVVSDLPLRILVGHKGTGKSALFKVAISEDKDKGNLPILIKPDDIAEFGKSDENFLLKIRQWKHGLIRIIGSKVFHELGISDDSLKNKLGQFGLRLLSFLHESIAPLKDTLSLSSSKRLLLDNFLKSKKIIVYIDDLDRGWQGKEDDINRISALLNAIRDLANDNDGLIFKVSLRSDVYYLVRTSDESTDKIESSVIWFRWTLHEILVMLIKRINTYFGIPYDEELLLRSPQNSIAHNLNRVFEERFSGSGKWSSVPMYRVLMTVIRKRPRDIVKLCTASAVQAALSCSNKITSQHISKVLEEYSQGRIQDTINEYISELPGIEPLLFGMRPSHKERKEGEGFIYSTVKLRAKISNISQNANLVFANKRRGTPENLAHFLFKINFLTARKTLEDGTILRKYFEENRYLSSKVSDFGFDWEVHPAFRWALQPDGLDDIITKISMNSDSSE